MDSDKFKISEQNMQGKGVSAQPNPMELPEAEAKAVFDQLVKEVVVPKFNEVLDALVPIDLTSDEDKPISTATQAALDLKVDKEKKTGSTTENKVLSDNNYSDSEKIKLSNVAGHANNYIHPATHDASMITGLATLAHNVVDGNNTGVVRTVGAKSNYTMGSHAFAEGVNTVASGVYSHAEGNGTIASGSRAHAEGFYTIASGTSAHAEGSNTISNGTFSHAEGCGTVVSGNYGGHAEGNGAIAVADRSVFKISSADKDAKKIIIDTDYFSYGTTPFNKLSVGNEILLRNPVYTNTTLRKYTIASIDSVEHSITVNETITDTNFNPDFFICFAAGDTGIYLSAHAEGRNVLASGYSSHAEGDKTVASGDYSHAEGGNTIASGAYAHAEGSSTTASGSYSHAEGSNTTAFGSKSHAEGSYTNSNGEASHAEGNYTTTNGLYSHAEGDHTIASGLASHAEGSST